MEPDPVEEDLAFLGVKILRLMDVDVEVEVEVEC